MADLARQGNLSVRFTATMVLGSRSYVTFEPRAVDEFP
jgi:hypothetical protein